MIYCRYFGLLFHFELSFSVGALPGDSECTTTSDSESRLFSLPRKFLSDNLLTNLPQPLYVSRIPRIALLLLNLTIIQIRSVLFLQPWIQRRHQQRRDSLLERLRLVQLERLTRVCARDRGDCVELRRLKVVG